MKINLPMLFAASSPNAKHLYYTSRRQEGKTIRIPFDTSAERPVIIAYAIDAQAFSGSDTQVTATR
jgi:hypothetical protein